MSLKFESEATPTPPKLPPVAVGTATLGCAAGILVNKRDAVVIAAGRVPALGKSKWAAPRATGNSPMTESKSLLLVGFDGFVMGLL